MCKFQLLKLIFAVMLLFSNFVFADFEGSIASEEQVSENSFKTDLEIIISSYESNDWFLDEFSINDLLKDLMPSACRINEELLFKIEDDFQEKCNVLGNPRELFGLGFEIDSDTITTALTCHRSLRAIKASIDKLSQCPFWVKKKSIFLPRQNVEGKVSFSFESGGMLQTRSLDGSFKTGGGGATRIFLVNRFNSLYSVLMGFEFSGGAFIRPEEPEEDVELRFYNSLPVLLRVHLDAWHVELETGPVITYTLDDTDPILGVRIGTGVGFSTLRIKNFLPWVGFVVVAEKYPFDNREKALFLKFGIRAGVYIKSK